MISVVVVNVKCEQIGQVPMLVYYKFIDSLNLFNVILGFLYVR